MILTIILFVIGFIILIKGADYLVDGSSSIASKYNISNLIIGYKSKKPHRLQVTGRSRSKNL